MPISNGALHLAIDGLTASHAERGTARNTRVEAISLAMMPARMRRPQLFSRSGRSCPIFAVPSASAARYEDGACPTSKRLPRHPFVPTFIRLHLLDDFLDARG